ncbi:hypothetical protein MKW98_005084, partial [Papaver atlanticum]
RSRANEVKCKGGLQPLVEMGSFLRKKFEVEDEENKKKPILAQALKDSPFWDFFSPFYMADINNIVTEK